MFPRLIVLVALCFVHASAACGAGVARLGIWSDASARDLAGLVAAKLSANPAFALLERDDLRKIAQEAALDRWLGGAKSAGRFNLEGVDAMLFLASAGTGESAGRRMRLVAVEKGIVISDTALPAGLGLELSAKAIVDRVAARIQKVRSSKGAALGLAVMNMRSTLPGPKWKRIESELSALLENRLANEADVFLLDRRTLADLEKEKMLGAGETPFEAGVWLVDGRIEPAAWSPSSQFRAELRLRRIHPATEIAFTMDARDEALPAAAGVIVSEILRQLNRTPDEHAWDRERESSQFCEEAVWAWQRKETDLALQAISTARALGSRTPDLWAMRISLLCPKAAATRAIGEEFPPAGDLREESQDAALELFHEALADWDSYDKEKGGDHLQYFNTREHPFVRPGDLKGLVLATGLRLLRDEIALRGTAAASALRERLRALAGFDPWQGRITGNWHVLYDFAPYLAHHPEELFAYYEGVLAAKTDHLRLCATALKRILRSRRADCLLPHLEPDAARRQALFAAFEQRLQKKPETELAFWFLQTHEKQPDTARIEASRRFLNAIYEKRKALLADGSFPYYATDAANLRAEKLEAETARLVGYYLEAAPPGEDTRVMSKLWRPELFPPETAPELWRLFRAYGDRCLQAAKAEGDQTFRNRQQTFALYEGKFAKVFPQIAAGVSAPAVHPLPVTRFWEAEIDDGKKAAHLEVRPAGDTAYVMALPEAGGGIFAVDLNTMQSRRVPFPADPSSGLQMLATKAAAFVFLKGSDQSSLGAIGRFDARTGATETRQTRPFHHQENFVSGEDIYLSLWTSGESGFAKLHWPSGETKILASSRRRPGRHQFDDCQEYGVGHFFLGPGGRVCVAVEGQPYYVREEAGEWPLLFARMEDAGKGPRFSEGSFWKISTLGTEAVLHSSRGDLVLIDPHRAEPAPVIVSERTAAILPAWRALAIWDAFDRSDVVDFNGPQMAAHRGEVFSLHRRPPRDGSGYDLRWFRKDGPRAGLRLPLVFRQPAQPKFDEANPARETEYDVHGSSVFAVPTMRLCEAGLTFTNRHRGFWFLPFSDLNKR